MLHCSGWLAFSVADAACGKARNRMSCDVGYGTVPWVLSRLAFGF